MDVNERRKIYRRSLRNWLWISYHVTESELMLLRSVLCSVLWLTHCLMVKSQLDNPFILTDTRKWKPSQPKICISHHNAVVFHLFCLSAYELEQARNSIHTTNVRTVRTKLVLLFKCDFSFPSYMFLNMPIGHRELSMEWYIQLSSSKNLIWNKN